MTSDEVPRGEVRDQLRHDHRRARRPQSDVPLRRSGRGAIGGVAAGIARFVGVPISPVRILWVVSIPLSGGLTGVAYLLLWLLLPGSSEEVGDSPA